MLRVKESLTTSLVNRDSAMRRAKRLAVQFDVGELHSLGNVRSREAVSAFIFLLATRMLWLACEVHFIGNVLVKIWSLAAFSVLERVSG
jgi:hypothetical protein